MDVYCSLINKSPNILVIGDVMLDKYINCIVNRYSKETDIPILDTQYITYKLGGAANVCNNIKQLGFSCTLISIVGEDEERNNILDLLREKDIDHHIEIIKNRPTTIKTRIYNSSRQVVRYDCESRNKIENDIESNLYEYIQKNLTKYNGIIISDYQKGCITDSLCKNIISLARKFNINVLIDAKNNDNNKLSGCTLFKPNRPEFEAMTNYTITDPNCCDFQRIIKELATSITCSFLLVTMDKLGFMLYDCYNSSFYHIPTSNSNTELQFMDTCGAGDTIISMISLVLLLFNNDNDCIEKYLKFVERCADSVIRKVGTSTISFEDILTISKKDDFLLSYDHLGIIHDMNKIMNKRILFTNGCFDILHSGHIDFLTECKKKCDIFILGLNSDESIQENKGDKRPIIPLKQRIYNLQALKLMDFIVVFDDKTPSSIIERLKPTILAKGDKDYTIDNIVGRENAEQTIVISTKEYYDTTKIINTIVNNYCK